MANIDKKTKASNKIIPLIVLLVLDLIITPIIAFTIYSIMKYNLKANEIIIETLKTPFKIYLMLFTTKDIFVLFSILQGAVVVMAFNIIFKTKINLTDTTETYNVANFQLPRAVGKGQMGTSRFTTDEEKSKTFKLWKEGEILGLLLWRHVA